MLTQINSSGETSILIVQTILALVAFPEGAKAFSEIEDVSPLVEVAPSNPSVLEVFTFAWINCMDLGEDRTILEAKIDGTIQALVSSFTGTDGVTLLEFLGKFLRNSDPKVIIPSRRYRQLTYTRIGPTIKSEMDQPSCRLYKEAPRQQAYTRSQKCLHHCGCILT